MSKPVIAVIGDVMLDRYWSGQTQRISPEAPVPIVHVEGQKDCIGGAGNVANNIAAQGAKCHLIASVGADEAANVVQNLCMQNDVIPHFVILPEHPTTIKLRVMARSQQLLRMDFEKKCPVSFFEIQALLEPLLQEIDLLVLSDYAKGMLSDVQAIIEYAKQNGIPVLVDPKQPSFEAYRGATVITPNFHEFETAVGRPLVDDQEIQNTALAMSQELSIDSIVITRGEKGMTVVNAAHQFSVPTVAKEIFDVTGAGDTVIALLAVELARGRSLVDAVHKANRAAAIAVSKLGTSVVTAEELSGTKNLGFRDRVVDEDTLLATILSIKAQGRRVVMTNGCFDILHPGHVQYLHQARALGDVLIVAVNTDNSVKLLKGPSRPVHPLWHRMEVLAGLSCVDWVVPFSEETPLRLIEKFLPHILVKGGDYDADSVVGSQVVRQHGGEVVIIPLVAGCATTQSIAKIRQYEES